MTMLFLPMCHLRLEISSNYSHQIAAVNIKLCKGDKQTIHSKGQPENYSITQEQIAVVPGNLLQ